MKDLLLKDIIHPAVDSPGKRAFYLFFLDPRGCEPIMMELMRFQSPHVTPSTVVWNVNGYQKLPLFWIYKEDFLKAIEYSKWAKEFERDVICDACFAFPDYKKCKADKVGKKLEP